VNTRAIFGSGAIPKNQGDRVAERELGLHLVPNNFGG
jgi:hypothetical protein